MEGLEGCDPGLGDPGTNFPAQLGGLMYKHVCRYGDVLSVRAYFLTHNASVCTSPFPHHVEAHCLGVLAQVKGGRGHDAPP